MSKSGSWSLLCGQASSSGDNTLVAAPGSGKRIRVGFAMIQNASSVLTTAILRSGTGTNGLRYLGANQGDGIQITFQQAGEWTLDTNEALILNLSGANAWNYTIAYSVEDV